MIGHGFLYGEACGEPCGHGGRRKCLLTLGHGGGHNPHDPPYGVRRQSAVLRLDAVLVRYHVTNQGSS